MKLVFDSAQLDNVLENNPLVMVYFSGENCGVCNSLKPKIEQLISTEFPSIQLFEIPTEKAPMLVGRFSMFAIPAVILFVEGRDYLREVRNISLPDLQRKIDKIISLYEK
ncbi:MAG: thioredoxin family protein [Prolixibacteraceae bacterium]|jgi:thioredoxin-like negative regulator of GroEL|nr:thioredoxin family protein [Prolixibacteraceae bacterium]